MNRLSALSSRSSQSPGGARWPVTLLAASGLLLSVGAVAGCDSPGSGGSGGVVGDPCVYNPSLPQCQAADGGGADGATGGDTAVQPDGATRADTAVQPDGAPAADTGPGDASSCTPSCAGRQCGDDGCGGSCGNCTNGQTCNTIVGQCESTCAPSCAGKQCGNDGCGGSCGSCAGGQTCNTTTGQCESTCAPSCAGKQCGNDGCGGSCGSCTAGLTCDTTTGQCESTCAPSCGGKQCGDDGCGGSCGDCTGGQTCNTTTGQCETATTGCGEITDTGCCTAPGVLQYCDGGTLKTIDCAAKNPHCGWRADSSFYDCGTDGAASPDTNHPLTCPDDTCTETCGAKECGFVCGQACGANNGGCPAGQLCSADGTCDVCTPQCSGKTCGDDGCGGSCGTCGADATCLMGTCIVDPCAAGGSGNVGCCLGTGIAYCSGGTAEAGGCESSCGWDTDGGYYNCDKTGEDPSGTNPLACEPAP